VPTSFSSLFLKVSSPSFILRSTIRHPTFVNLRISSDLTVIQAGNESMSYNLGHGEATIVILSMAATHNEQSHIVAWRTSLAETGDILQNTVSRDFRRVVTMIPKCANQAVFFVLIALRIL
jgi:hypothetical protein